MLTTIIIKIQESYTQFFLKIHLVNSKPPEIEDKINITLVINYSVKYKKWRDIQFNFFLLLKTWAKKLVKIEVKT